MKKETLTDLSMLILRIVVGGMFIIHGAQKLFGMFDGMGLEDTARLVESLGAGMGNPHAVALVWGAVEFIGGIFLVLGIFVRWSALAIATTVFIQLLKINITYGFLVQGRSGIEDGLLFIGVCVPLILMGGGRWSVWDA